MPIIHLPQTNANQPSQNVDPLDPSQEETSAATREGSDPTKIVITPVDFWTVSMWVAFSRCERLHFYLYESSLKFPMPPPAFLFGEAMHVALPTAHITGDLHVATADFMKVWSKTPQEDEKHNKEMAQIILLEFIKKHGGGRSPYELILPPKNTLAISDRVSPYEIAFAQPIPGMHIPFCGRMDGLCRMKDTGEMWVLEYKTTSELSERFLQGFQFNPQITAYTTMANVIFKDELEGKPIKGGIMQGLFKPKPLKTKAPSGDSEIQRVYVKQNHMEEFVQTLQYDCARMHAMELADSAEGVVPATHWPKRRTGCNPYSQFAQAGYTCAYSPICDVEDWRLLRSMLVYERYFPFKLKKEDQDVKADQQTGNVSQVPLSQPQPTASPVPTVQ